MPIEVRVEALLLGTDQHSLVKFPHDSIQVELDGIVGDKHRGYTKPADGRDQGVARGTPVRNWRQWTAVSIEELKVIAERMKVERLDPAWLGANLALSGLENLTQVPKGSMIWFPSGAVLEIEGENAPCTGPGKEIARHFSHVKPVDFPKSAVHLRGLVGVVYKAGEIKVGDVARIELYQSPTGKFE